LSNTNRQREVERRSHTLTILATNKQTNTSDGNYSHHNNHI
jgi:hypothetical protein